MIRLFLAFCSLLPLRANHSFGAFLGKLLFVFNSNAKNASRRNLEICFPNLSKSDLRKLLKKALVETGKNLTESGLIWNQSFEENTKLIRNIKGENYLESPKKTILLVPHIGCWEITGRVIANKRKITFMYRPLRNLKQNEYLFARRNQGKLIMASANKSGILKIHRALSSGELVGILPDQDPGEDGGIMVPFFNKEVNTMTLLSRLAKKHNAQVLMFWAKRLEKGRGYDLNIEPVDLSKDGEDIESYTKVMNNSIESLIRKTPEQYMWGYRRFKSSHSYQ